MSIPRDGVGPYRQHINMAVRYICAARIGARNKIIYLENVDFKLRLKTVSQTIINFDRVNTGRKICFVIYVNIYKKEKKCRGPQLR